MRQAIVVSATIRYPAIFVVCLGKRMVKGSDPISQKPRLFEFARDRKAIVFTWVSDPVGSGFAANLPIPAETSPAFIISSRPSVGSGWAFLKQIAPGQRRVAVVHFPEIVPNVAFLRVIEAAAPSLGVSVTTAEVRNAADIEDILLAFGQGGGGLIVIPGALTATRRDLIIGLAARLRLPAIYSFGFMPRVGA